MANQNLSGVTATELMQGTMQQAVSPVMLAALLVAWRNKTETVEELTAAATVMRGLCVPVCVPVENQTHLVDIVGTGGDGANTFNISTCAMLVAAAAGATVSKHGGRSVSSQSGSADVLHALGVAIDLAPSAIAQCIAQIGVGFMFAPNHHPAMKNVAPVRKELGIKTIFNILGPLTNPAKAPHVLLGVFDVRLVPLLVQTLKALGSQRALVVHGRQADGSGIDEISTSGLTCVSELRDGYITHYHINPLDFGITPPMAGVLQVNSPTQSKDLLLAVLNHQALPSTAVKAGRDIVAINAGAALYVCGVAESMIQGVDLARGVLASGKGLSKLHQLQALSVSLQSDLSR